MVGYLLTFWHSRQIIKDNQTFILNFIGLFCFTNEGRVVTAVIDLIKDEFSKTTLIAS